MDFAVLNNPTWRDVLVLIVALLAIYVLVVLLRMRRLRKVEPIPTLSQTSAVAAYAATRDAESTPVPKSGVEPDFPWNEPPPEIPGQREIARLEGEVTRLRAEIDELRAELRGELDAAREEFRGELMQSRATQSISPVYSEAMQMAMQGHDAQSISEHCGVARAEAELVVALVRSR